LNSNGKLVNFLNDQIRIENKILDSLRSSLVEMANPAVKGVLKGISLDSAKHAEMYAAAINLLTSVPPALTQEHLDKQREVVEKHICMEAELIEKIGEALPSIENDKVKGQ